MKGCDALRFPLLLAAILCFPLGMRADESPTVGVRLRKAASTGDLSTVKALLQTTNPDESTKEGITPLMLAAGRGQQLVVSALLAAGAHINRKSTDKAVTPLMFAAYGCHRTVAETLLTANADASLKDRLDNSAADYAFNGCKLGKEGEVGGVPAKEVLAFLSLLHEKGATVKPRGDGIGLLLGAISIVDAEAILKKADDEK